MNLKSAGNKAIELMKKYGGCIVVMFTAVSLFLMLWPVYLTTHDDFWAFIVYFCEGSGMNTPKEIWEYTLNFSYAFSRFWSIVTYPLFIGKVLYATGNYLLYKAVCYGTMIFELAAVYYVMKKILNRECAQLIIITYFIAAWLDTQHNLLVSYPGLYHPAFGLFWISVYLLLCYYKDGNSRTQKFSALCYCISCIFYENMVPYAILIFSIACIVETVEKNKVTIMMLWQAVKNLKWHIISMSIYMLITVIWRILHPSVYNGNVIQFDSVFDVWYTLWVFVKTQMPVWHIADVLKQTTFAELVFDPSMFGYVVKACIAAVTCTILIAAIHQIKAAKLIVLMILGEIGAVLSVVLISLTPKYIKWVKIGTTAYLPSYYAYVFHVIVLCAGILLIYQKLPGLFRPCMALICFSSVFLLSLCTDYHNINVRENAFIPQEHRWETFRKVFENKEICSKLNEHDQIYVPYHQNIANTTLDEMQTFAKDRSGKRFEFFQDIKDVDFKKMVWKLDYDDEQKCMVLGRFHEDLSIPDFYIVSHDSLQDRLLIFKDAENVKINHAAVEHMRGTAVCSVNEISDSIYVEGANMEDLLFVHKEVCSYYDQEEIDFTSEADNASQYCLQGFSSCEGEFTWSDGKRGYLFLNLQDYQGGDLQLEIEVFQVFGSGRCKISGINGVIAERYLEAGVNKMFISAENVWNQNLLLCFEYPDAVSPSEVSESGDTRILAVAYTKMKLLYK